MFDMKSPRLFVVATATATALTYLHFPLPLFQYLSGTISQLWQFYRKRIGFVTE